MLLAGLLGFVAFRSLRHRRNVLQPDAAVQPLVMAELRGRRSNHSQVSLRDEVHALRAVVEDLRDVKRDPDLPPEYEYTNLDEARASHL